MKRSEVLAFLQPFYLERNQINDTQMMPPVGMNRDLDLPAEVLRRAIVNEVLVDMIKTHDVLADYYRALNRHNLRTIQYYYLGVIAWSILITITMIINLSLMKGKINSFNSLMATFSVNLA